jgi:hypothetical protein
MNCPCQCIGSARQRHADRVKHRKTFINPICLSKADIDSTFNSYLIPYEDITRLREDMDCMFEWQKQYILSV